MGYRIARLCSSGARRSLPASAPNRSRGDPVPAIKRIADPGQPQKRSGRRGSNSRQSACDAGGNPPLVRRFRPPPRPRSPALKCRNCPATTWHQTGTARPRRTTRRTQVLARYGAGDGVRTRDIQVGKPEAVPRWFTAGSPIAASSARAIDRCMERKLLYIIDLEAASDAHVRVGSEVRGTSGRNSLCPCWSTMSDAFNRPRRGREVGLALRGGSARPRCRRR